MGGMKLTVMAVRATVKCDTHATLYATLLFTECSLILFSKFGGFFFQDATDSVFG
jgi:hypothetical protein